VPKTARGERLRKMRCVDIEHRHPRIVTKLIRQMMRKFGVEFEQQQFGLRSQMQRNLSRVAAFAGSELSNDPRLREIHLLRNLPHESARTRDNGGHLQRPLEKSLEEKCAHEQVPENKGADCKGRRANGKRSLHGNRCGKRNGWKNRRRNGQMALFAGRKMLP